MLKKTGRKINQGMNNKHKIHPPKAESDLGSQRCVYIYCSTLCLAHTVNIKYWTSTVHPSGTLDELQVNKVKVMNVFQKIFYAG